MHALCLLLDGHASWCFNCLLALLRTVLFNDYGIRQVSTQGDIRNFHPHHLELHITPLGNDIRINLTDINAQQPKIKPHLSSPIHQSPKRSTPSKRERTRTERQAPAQLFRRATKSHLDRDIRVVLGLPKPHRVRSYIRALHTRNGIAFFLFFFSCENEKTRHPQYAYTHKKKRKEKKL